MFVYVLFLISTGDTSGEAGPFGSVQGAKQ